MTPPVVELRGVSKSFQRRDWAHEGAEGVAAMRDVHLSVAAAEIVGLVGESGAGKSTLGRIVLGLERPDRGQVLFAGRDLAQLPERSLRPIRRQMHLVFQDPYESLHPGLRVAAAVAEPLVIAGEPAAGRLARVQAALEEVDLTPVQQFIHRFPHELSGGQRQRVALARALVGRPRLVVADEPTSMLDVSLRAGILDLIGRLRTQHGIAFLFITHDLAMARYVADRIGVLHEGRLIELGPAEQVTNHPQQAYTQVLLAASTGGL